MIPRHMIEPMAGQTDRRVRSALLVAGVAFALAACEAPTSRPDAAVAQTPETTAARSEEVVAYTSSNIEFFRDAFAGRLNDDPVTLEGRLFLPEGDGPFPVAVWQHGSDHPRQRNYADWRNDLRAGLAAEGIGFFVADSYSGRGIDETSSNQGQLSGASRVTDALRALEALAHHPRIDPARIGIAGASWGGAVALRTSHEAYAATVLPGRLRYAAHVPLYPNCGAHFERYEPTGAPLLFLLGGADNYTNPDFCRQLADKMQRAGAQVEVVVYPGAHHGFISSDPVYRNRSAWQFNDCSGATLGSDGEMRASFGNSAGMSFQQYIVQAIRSGCARKGVNIGRDERAAQDTLKRIVAFLTAHLKSERGT